MSYSPLSQSANETCLGHLRAKTMLEVTTDGTGNHISLFTVWNENGSELGAKDCTPHDCLTRVLATALG